MAHVGRRPGFRRADGRAAHLPAVAGGGWPCPGDFDSPPLGVLFIAATLEAAGHTVGVVDAHAEQLDIHGIAGGVHAEAMPERMLHNPARPMPAYHLVEFDRYYPGATTYRHLPATNLLMTRGCPGRCTFCNSAMTTLRARSPASMVAQIRHLHDKYGIRQFQTCGTTPWRCPMCSWD